MGSASSRPPKTTHADELDKLGQQFVEAFVQAKNAEEQVRAPFKCMCEMQGPCVKLLTRMEETINNIPKEAQQDFIECIRAFDKLLKETMRHCVVLKDIVDEQNSAISNINKLKRLANEHGRAVIGNPTFRTFAEKARNNVATSSQKTDAAHPVTERLIKEYNALGRRFSGLQKVLEDSSADYRTTKWIFVGTASALAIATVVCIVLAVVLPPAGAAAGATLAAGISTAEAGAIAGVASSGGMCAVAASTAGALALGCSAGAVTAAAYQKKAAAIEGNLKKLSVGSSAATKMLEILNVKCGNAQNAGRHVDGSLSGSDDSLDLNVLFTNLQEDNDMMESLDKYKKSIKELRRSIDNLEQESAKNYMKMIDF